MKRNHERGSILMEYLILLVFVGAVLAVTSNRLFYGAELDPDDPTVAHGHFGPVGRQIQGFYQRTLGGLSLPVP